MTRFGRFAFLLVAAALLSLASVFASFVFASDDITFPENKVESGIYLMGDWNIDFTHTAAPLDLRQDWQKLYNPPSPGGETLSKRRSSLEVLSYGLSLEAYVGKSDGWRLSGRVSETLGGILFIPGPYIGMPSLLRHRTVGTTYVNWWDSVIGREVVIHRETPMFGISLTKRGRGFSYMTYRYNTTIENFEGIDCVDCRNSSQGLGKKPYDRGWAHRIAFRIFDKTQRRPESAEFYIEIAGKSAWSFGTTVHPILWEKPKHNDDNHTPEREEKGSANAGIRLCGERELDITHTSMPLKLKDNWTDQIWPPLDLEVPDTYYEKRTGLEFMPFALSIEAFTGKYEGWRATVRASEPIAGFTFTGRNNGWFSEMRHRPVGRAIVDLNTITLYEVAVRRTMPMLSISLAKRGWGLTYTTYSYRITTEDFRAVYRQAMHTDAQTYEHGWAHRIGIRIPDRKRNSYEFFAERASKTWRAGVTKRFTIFGK